MALTHLLDTSVLTRLALRPVRDAVQPRAQAGELARAGKHQRGRKIPDLLIAAAAEASDLIVLHYDADFDRIAAVTGQHCEWVLPAGSID